ncbi:MAG: HD domain-containing protein [Turicibacter sp.]|nr:HD domain-containing protein [Turicibacter sp.]
MQALADEKVFKCPIHSFIRVTDKLIWELIEAPEFQRLRRIKQLGGTHIVYPTAEHSRFSHSLGVYFIARRMIDVLNKQGTRFTDSERMLILCAALLHDLGHGPFSHSFETVLNIDHEDFTRRILLEHTQINHLLEGYQTGFSQEVSDVIAKKHPNRLIVSLISSEIDADRLDYLLRDSYFTGTPYGEIDLERILRTMRVVNGKIAFKHSGMHAIEDYLFSRYQMYWQVYLHDCSLSFNFLIQSLLTRVKKLLTDGYAFNCDMRLFHELFATTDININTYLRFDDGVITTFAGFFLEESDATLRDLASKFLNRGLLKEFDYEPQENSPQLYEQLASAMEMANIDTVSYLFNFNHEQSTYDHYGLDCESIDILTADGISREISTVSNIIQGIVNAPKKKSTIFLALDHVKASANKEQLEKALEALIGRSVHV